MSSLSAVEYRALAEFRYQVRRFLAVSEAMARGRGIEPRQHQLLLALKGLPEGQHPTISTCAERLQLRHHSVVELVDRAEERGFLHRVRDGEDRREVHLALTPAGEALLADISQDHRQELHTTGPALIRTLLAMGLEGSNG